MIENPTAEAAALVPLAHDPDPRVRRCYVVLAPDYRRHVPREALQTLAVEADDKVRAMTAACLDVPAGIRAQLAADPEPVVRKSAVNRKTWKLLSPDLRAALLDDPDPDVRAAVERAKQVDAPLPRTVTQYRADTQDRRRQAAGESPLDRELSVLLASDEDPGIRRALAGNPHTPTDVALQLAEDPDDGVRLTLSQREDLTEEQRAAIAYIVPSGYTYPPKWISENGHDPAVARRAAASSHVLLRRSIAMTRQLPPDVVDLLAKDEDFFVKLTLCESCPDAPHELVIEMYAYWHGLRWSLLMSHPNFAKPGLARFADHPNPRLRHAALHDPDGGPDLVLRLADDSHVGGWAVSDPRLPHDELVRRLGDPPHAMAAARNPALPAETMHRLLDLAGASAETSHGIRQ
ncbi:hypothetical protein [Streptacidiphilus sp. MAP12-33]|uniref:hypothetical protein n=1 Tax=Streptacidiphilus sp. MAP12-33 TaxID=3156266 RepID=UPI003516A0EB